MKREDAHNFCAGKRLSMRGSAKRDTLRHPDPHPDRHPDPARLDGTDPRADARTQI